MYRCWLGNCLCGGGACGGPCGTCGLIFTACTAGGVLLLLQFGDGRKDRHPTPTSTGASPRSVGVVPHRRVLADNVDQLSAVLERRSRRPTALAFRALFRLRAFTHKFRFRDHVVLLPRERLWGRLGQRRQTLDRIRVPMIRSLYIASGFMIMISKAIRRVSWQSHSQSPGVRETYQLVPHASNINIPGPTHPDPLVIPHRKLGAPQPFSRSLFGKRIRQILALVKRPLGTTQEPLAQRHVRLDFPLLPCERVVLDAQQGVKRKGCERKLVRMAELVLGWREMEECRTF